MNNGHQGDVPPVIAHGTEEPQGFDCLEVVFLVMTFVFLAVSGLWYMGYQIRKPSTFSWLYGWSLIFILHQTHSENGHTMLMQ